MSNPVSFVAKIPNNSPAAIIELLKLHPEIYRTSPDVCYFVSAGSSEQAHIVNQVHIKPVVVSVAIAEIGHLESNLPDVFVTLKQGGKCYIALRISPGKHFNVYDFWDVFEEQTLKKDSALIIAKIAFGLVLRLIRRQTYKATLL